MKAPGLRHLNLSLFSSSLLFSLLSDYSSGALILDSVMRFVWGKLPSGGDIRANGAIQSNSTTE